ncbi:MAG: nicotinamide mononucleotide transporter [Bacteroidales bacterium]|nr:nicotinamide mononucleotide transporter [Bacteroidales bacterium]
MEKIKEFVKNELSGWKLWEILWISISTLTILILSIYWKERLVGIISAITGVICVVMTGKGKVSSYIFGLVNTVLYAYIAYGAKYYGEVMLNLLYFVPMNVVGWVMWNKHINEETKEVEKKKMKGKWRIFVLAISAIGVLVYGLFLKRMGGNLPYTDSLTAVLSIVAQILCVKRFMEQWALWIIIDIVTVIMWIMAFFNGGESVATLIMWNVYLLNAVFMFIKWNRESRRAEANV